MDFERFIFEIYLHIYYYWCTTLLELTMTVLFVMLAELVPATLVSLSLSNLTFFNYESAHVQ
jgi:hypothetical protein